MPIKPKERISIATEFKKGQEPKNKLPIGSVTIRQHKGDSKRAWVKVREPNEWMARAQFVWLEHGGNIPNGFVIHHIDEDTLNDDIKNLSLVSRGWHINHHRENLQSAKIGLVLSEKQVTCSKCGASYQGKAQRRNGVCDECRIESHRESKRRYKERIRAERRERNSDNS